MTTNLFSYVENSLRQAEEKRRERKRRRLRKLRLVGKVREEGGEEEKKLGAPVFVQEDSNVVCVQHIREGWSPTHTRGWWLLRKNSDWREEAGRDSEVVLARQSPLLRAFQYMGKGL